jgi:hypothetical protein
MVTYLFSCLYTKSSYKVNKKSLVMLLELIIFFSNNNEQYAASLWPLTVLFYISFFLFFVQPFRVSSILNERNRIY